MDDPIALRAFRNVRILHPEYLRPPFRNAQHITFHPGRCAPLHKFRIEFPQCHHISTGAIGEKIKIDPVIHTHSIIHERRIGNNILESISAGIQGDERCRDVLRDIVAGFPGEPAPHFPEIRGTGAPDAGVDPARSRVVG